MTITYETSIKDFDFWGYACENKRRLTEDEPDQLDDILADSEFNQTELNDWFAFYFEDVCEILELDYDEVMARDD